MVKHFADENELLNYIKKETCILDFYADWCGPCKMLLPVLDEIDFTDVLKVNVLEQEREIGYRGLEEIKKTFDSIM